MPGHMPLLEALHSQNNLRSPSSVYSAKFINIKNRSIPQTSMLQQLQKGHTQEKQVSDAIGG